MLRSKATAALMKLKEIDRKYKMKCSEESKVHSSLSDISTIDSTEEISKHKAMAAAGSGDKPDLIITPRTKLDIRMPDAHMERVVQVQENESELVTIFNKAKKQSPKLDSDISRKVVTVSEKTVDEPPKKDSDGEEENASAEKLHVKSPQNSLSAISEEKSVDHYESSISEDVLEVISSSHVPETIDASHDVTLKSGDSILDEDEDPSTLIPSGMYSDDFDKTHSDTPENSKESNRSRGNTQIQDPDSTSSELKRVANSPPRDYQHRRSPKLDNETEPETANGEIVELISAKVLRAVSECDASLDSGLRNYVKKIDHSVNEGSEDPVCLLQRTSQSSSTRSSRERRMKRRPRTVSSSCRDSLASKSPEFSSSSDHKRKSKGRVSSGSLNPSKSELHSGANFPDLDQSGGSAAEIDVLFARKREKELKTPETVSFLEAGSLLKDNREVEAEGFSRNPKNERSGLKINSTNPKNQITAKESSTKKAYRSAIQSAPITSAKPAVLKFTKSSTDDEVVRSAQCIRKDCANNREPKRSSNKQQLDDSFRSKHRSKSGSMNSHCKNKNDKDERVLTIRDVDGLRQEINELRSQQEKDRLRVRVRYYVQQMMNEQRRLLARDDRLGGSIDQDDYNPHSAGVGAATASATAGFRRTESLRLFFKPLDLPNVAAFKRPDFEEEQVAAAAAAADLDNELYLHSRMVRERVLGIRHWLKQQFVLYRDYSSLVSTINAKYVPVTLFETKKMIRDSQRIHNNREWRRHVR